MEQIHKSNSRGYFDHGWLRTNHSFSFAGYMNKNRIRFGDLRVLNDDFIDPGEGFGLHPHSNMEIISLILKGKLAHKDSKGHEHVSSEKGIQVMSAGSGIYHSEYNASDTEVCNLLQIWIFPDAEGHTPRYDQSEINPEEIKNKPFLFVGPKESKANLWINQNAYLSLVELDGCAIEYKNHDEKNGLFIFVIEGNCQINNHQLQERDSIEITENISTKLSTTNKVKLLFIEVPLINGV